jgi:hypothetical protein
MDVVYCKAGRVAIGGLCGRVGKGKPVAAAGVEVACAACIGAPRGTAGALGRVLPVRRVVLCAYLDGCVFGSSVD